jgi:hypothetical protein
MLAPLRPTCSSSPRANEWAGLPEPPGHRRVAAQEVRNLAAGEPRQYSVPFLKHWTNVSTLASHPTPKVLPGGVEQPPVVPKPGCDLPILRGVGLVN